MGIISYAQNFEDVLLFRALKDVDRGFYIDVGAQHPVVDSVSKAFHDAGWEGIHVEPVAHYAEQLRHDRPGDQVFAVGIGAERRAVRFFEFTDTGLSTASETVARAHIEQGLTPVERELEFWTMDHLLSHATGRVVHWLKIDVEGYEWQVFSGWRVSELRPWILVVEATFPNSARSTADEWESLIVEKGYALAHDDGLNRYYVHRSQSSRIGLLRHGPNVFDEYQLADSVWSTRHALAGRERVAADLRSELDSLRTRSQALEQDLRHELQAARAETQSIQEWSSQKLREAQVAHNLVEVGLLEAQESLKAAERERSGLKDELDRSLGRAEDLVRQVADLTAVCETLRSECAGLELQARELVDLRAHSARAAEDAARNHAQLLLLEQQLFAATSRGDERLASARSDWLQEKLDLQVRLQEAATERERQSVAAKEALALVSRDAELRLTELREQCRLQLAEKDAQLARQVDEAKHWRRELDSREQVLRQAFTEAEAQQALTLDELRRGHEARSAALEARVEQSDAALQEALRLERALREQLLAAHGEASTLRQQASAELAACERQVTERLGRAHAESLKALVADHEQRFASVQVEHARLVSRHEALEAQLRRREDEWLRERADTTAQWEHRLGIEAARSREQLDAAGRALEDERRRLGESLADLSAQIASKEAQLRSMQEQLNLERARLGWSDGRSEELKQDLDRFSVLMNQFETARSAGLEKNPKAKGLFEVGRALTAGIDQARRRLDLSPPQAGPDGELQRSSSEDEADPAAVRVLHVDELLLMPAPRLIEQAYRTLLGRRPDSIGRAHYMKRLALGDGSAAIVHAIATSPEARARKAPALPGLDAFIEDYRRSRRGLRGLIRLLVDGRRAANRSSHLIESLALPSLATDGQRGLEPASSPRAVGGPQALPGAAARGSAGSDETGAARLAAAEPNAGGSAGSEAKTSSVASARTPVALPLKSIRRRTDQARRSTPLAMLGHRD